MKLLTALMVSLLLATGAAAQLIHRDSANGYQFTVPEGWVRMSKQELDQLKEGAKQMKGAREDSMIFEAGYRPKGTLPGMPPFMVVAFKANDNSREDYDSIEKGLQQSVSKELKKIKDDNTDLIDSLEVGAAVLDRSRNRIILRLTMGVNNIVDLDVLAFWQIGSKGLVFINCYSAKEDFQKNKAVFESMSSSFQFDPGHEFVPKDNSLSVRVAKLAGSITCICLTLAGVIWIIRKLFTKPRKQKRRPDYEHDDF